MNKPTRTIPAYIFVYMYTLQPRSH